MQTVNTFASKLYHNALSSFRMIPYGCLSTGSFIGMIEVVHQAETLAKLQRMKGGVRAAFSRDSIWNWLREYHSTEDRCVLFSFYVSGIVKFSDIRKLFLTVC